MIETPDRERRSFRGEDLSTCTSWSIWDAPHFCKPPEEKHLRARCSPQPDPARGMQSGEQHRWVCTGEKVSHGPQVPRALPALASLIRIQQEARLLGWALQQTPSLHLLSPRGSTRRKREQERASTGCSSHCHPCTLEVFGGRLT